MLKTHKETIKQEKEIVDDILCNCCGKPIPKQGNMFEDYIHVSKTFGYLSHHDGEIHKLDICENCYNKITKTFKIKPSIIEC